jgi:hypothetical protein
MLPTSSHVRVDSACAQPNQAAAKNPRNSAVSPASRRDFTGPTLPCLVSAVQYCVNAAEVQEAILQAVNAAPDTKALILDLESTDQLETTSADMLSELRDQLAEHNVDLYLVRVRWPVRIVLARTGFRARLGEDHLWHGVAQGVRVARRQHGIERPEQPEPEPIMEEAEEVKEAEEEIVATPSWTRCRRAKSLAAFADRQVRPRLQRARF